MAMNENRKGKGTRKYEEFRKKETTIVLCFLMCLFLIGYGDALCSDYFVNMLLNLNVILIDTKTYSINLS